MPSVLTEERYYQILDEQYEEAMRDFLEASRAAWLPDGQEVTSEARIEESDQDLDLPF